MDYLFQYGLFLAQAATIVAALLLLVGSIGGMIRHAQEQLAEQLEIKNLNERYERMADILRHEMLDEHAHKSLKKQQKKEQKAKSKAAKLGSVEQRPRLFVLDFDGDIRASAVENLREEISAVLQVAQTQDEVLLRLESPGGLVHSYGLAASQLRRLRDHGVRLVASVDRVAASGGYLMACVADRIVAAPFAIVGSIGVVAQLPNFNRLLKEHHVDFELHTAGEHKRTLTMFGENTDEARNKFREEIEDTHTLFKDFLVANRDGLDLDKVATGEHWFGTRALELSLIDEIKTSDDYLLDAAKQSDIFSVSYKIRKPLSERLGHAMRAALPGWRAKPDAPLKQFR